MAYDGELIPAHCPDPEQDPSWLDTLRLLARDKHVDWIFGMRRFWMEKLKAYPEPLVEHILIHSHWKLFPSADEVIEEIELLRETWRQESAERSWMRWKLEQERAGREGLLATEQDYAELREAAKRLAMSKRLELPPAPPTVRISRHEPTDAEIRDRKQMLRQQVAQLEARRKAEQAQ